MIWGTSRQIPILHVASMARSGETILLRCLNEHSELRVVHNLSDVDRRHEIELFEFLQSYEPRSISNKHPGVVPFGLRRGQRLVLKQAVWKHGFPFEGFVLARNPVSIFASLKVYDCKTDTKNWHQYWHLNEARLIRWLQKIDPAKLDGFADLSPLNQFARFYRTRAKQLLDTQKRIVRYEEFVSGPESVLQQISKYFQIRFEPAMLQSHQSYPANQLGHGQNSLDQPIHSDSLFKYMQHLTASEFEQLANLTGSEAEQFGYRLQWGCSGWPTSPKKIYREAV